MNKPTLIVVTGRPGSGKTTLAKRLGAEARLPVVSRDAIKEGYVRTMGKPHAELPDGNRVATDVFFQTVEVLLDGGVSLVAEAAFQHRLWSARLEPLMHKARIVVLVCLPGDDRTAYDRTAYDRYLRRRADDPMRVYYHGDGGEAGEVPTYDPPRLDVPTLNVDTTDGYRPSVSDLLGEIFRRTCESGANPL